MWEAHDVPIAPHVIPFPLASSIASYTHKDRRAPTPTWLLLAPLRRAAAAATGRRARVDSILRSLAPVCGWGVMDGSEV